jgi:hypothetical protein
VKGKWRKKLDRKFQTLEASTLPPELEAAFLAVEKMPRFADAPETRAVARRLAQDGR